MRFSVWYLVHGHIIYETLYFKQFDDNVIGKNNYTENWAFQFLNKNTYVQYNSHFESLFVQIF